MGALAESTLRRLGYRDLYRFGSGCVRPAVPGAGRGGGAVIYLSILVMAVTTYLVRALPLTLLKKPIHNRFLKSFLHYVPTACLTAMTFPAILSATENMISGAIGLAVAVLLALKKKSLIVVAVASCVAVFLMEQLIKIL
ncbi:MAG: AzlD domain-containing protein [Oscillospiraceae bacterium]|nr:AzlD domain-containing protein [Oscillospiraceae bacterium]